jgi:hypothetical protein
MGCVESITEERFPRQGRWVGQRAKVCFHYDINNGVMGTYVRDDCELPFVTIIRLDDGRHVLATECQHQPQELSLCIDDSEKTK